MSKLKDIDISYELFLTFSNQKSLLSSKRIERFLTFVPATLMLITYFICKLLCLECISSFDTTSVILLSSTLYGYGAYTTAMMMKEKRDEHKDENS